jgi:hypothetical protein
MLDPKVTIARRRCQSWAQPVALLSCSKGVVDVLGKRSKRSDCAIAIFCRAIDILSNIYLVFLK